MTKQEWTDSFYDALHEVAGTCGHCGERKCPGKQEHSQLPGTISLSQIDQAIEQTAKKKKKKNK
jgi:hypothetical protein